MPKVTFITVSGERVLGQSEIANPTPRSALPPMGAKNSPARGGAAGVLLQGWCELRSPARNISLVDGR